MVFVVGFPEGYGNDVRPFCVSEALECDGGRGSIDDCGCRSLERSLAAVNVLSRGSKALAFDMMK